jgi:AraC family transcriptional regulator
MRQYLTCHCACGREPLHRHALAYAALVLEGEYEEASVDGRFLCRAGDIVVHPAHHAHANCFGHRGARVLNIALSSSTLALDCYAVFSACDPERLSRSPDAALALQEISAKVSRAAARVPPPWMEGLAARLRRDAAAGTSTPVSELARIFGITAQHASRAFTAHFGVSPARFRKEHRLRAAYRQLRAGNSPSGAASVAGFADQSHLTREFKRFAGTTPARLRG